MKFKRTLPLITSLMLMAVLAPTIVSCGNSTVTPESNKVKITKISEHGSINLFVDGVQLLESSPILEQNIYVKVEVVADDGYQVSGIYLDDVLLSDFEKASFVTPAKETATLKVTYINPDISGTIEVTKTGNGEVILDKTSGNAGEEIKATITPANEYFVSSVTFNGDKIEYNKELGYVNLILKKGTNSLNVIFSSNTQTGFDHLYANDKIKPSRGSQGSVDDYYESVRGLKGPELKAGLNKIIKNHETFSYNSLSSAMLVTDVDPFNSSNIILTYEGSKPKSIAYNKEHTWAKSIGSFDKAQGAGTDMHHLRPSDSNLNSTRSNFKFGKVNNGKDAGQDYKWSRESMKGNKISSNTFEPKDEFKGDVARMIFYMATRYEGDEGGVGYPDLEVGSSNGSMSGISNSKYYTFSGAKGIHGSFEDLYEWATGTIDPVSNFEVNRNNIIDEKYQHNRNPFIDHPEFVQMIYDKNYNGPGALIDK